MSEACPSIYSDLTPKIPLMAAPDDRFRQYAKDMWDYLFVGIRRPPQIPGDWADRFYTSLVAAREERKIREENIVVRGPIDFSPEEAEAELTLLALILLRDGPTIYRFLNGPYEWQLDDTQAIAEEFVSWIQARLEAGEPVMHMDFGMIRQFLRMRGLLPEWLDRYFFSIIALGEEAQERRMTMPTEGRTQS